MDKMIVIPSGNNKIYGMLHLPQNFSTEKVPVIVICHGFISNKIGQHQIFVKAARNFCDNGYAVFRFDYPGCGESTGEHKNITLFNQVRETIKVLNFLTTEPLLDTDNIILLGHSFGGCVASLVAGQAKQVKSLILWSPVANPLEDIVGIVGRELWRQSLDGKSAIYQGFELGREFFLSLSQMSPLEKIKDFNGNVLIIHGSEDVDTPVINAKFYECSLEERLRGTQKINIITGADHTYSSPVWETEAIRLTANWLNEGQYNYDRSVFNLGESGTAKINNKIMSKGLSDTLTLCFSGDNM